LKKQLNNTKEVKWRRDYRFIKCEVCGNIVEVVHGGAGELTCCGQTMKLLTENTVDAAKEKHVPVIEKISGGLRSW
jgi:superoxide reductase